MIFVSQIVPKEQELLDKRISNAAQLYQEKFIEFTNPFAVISIYPHFINTYADVHEKKNNVHYLNKQYKVGIPMLESVIKLIANSFKALRIILKHEKQELWFYNLNLSTFVIAFFAKIIFGRPSFIILADYSPSKTLKDILITQLIRKLDGGIVLNTNCQFFKNTVVMPGLLRTEEIVKPGVKKELSNTIFLSGSLGRTTGFDFALNFFSKHKEYQLLITGRPFDLDNDEFENLLHTYSNCKNIQFLGLLPYNEYLEILKKCDVALSLRDPEADEHNYNFPSKILEYLCHNKLVVSTIQYTEVSEKTLFFTEKTELGLQRVLKTIFSMPSHEVNEVKNNIYNEIYGKYSKERLLENLKKIRLNA